MEMIVNMDILAPFVLIAVCLIALMGIWIWTISKRNRELESEIAHLRITEEIMDMVTLLGIEGNHKSVIPVLEAVTDAMKRFPTLDRHDLESVTVKLKAEL